MEKHHIAIGAVALLVLAGGIYQGCLASPGDSGTELIGSADPPMEVPPLMPSDAGPPPATTPSMPSANAPTVDLVPDRCGGLTCAAGERCCPSTGECHPDACTDCCPLPMPAPTFPGYVAPGDEEPTPPAPGGAGIVPPPTVPTVGPGPGPDPAWGPGR